MYVSRPGGRRVLELLVLRSFYRGDQLLSRRTRDLFSAIELPTTRVSPSLCCDHTALSPRYLLDFCVWPYLSRSSTVTRIPNLRFV